MFIFLNAQLPLLSLHVCSPQFKTIFSSFKDIKVIQFSSMQDAFLGFSDKASFISRLFFLVKWSKLKCLHTITLIMHVTTWSEKGGKIQVSCEEVCRYMVLRRWSLSWSHILWHVLGRETWLETYSTTNSRRWSSTVVRPSHGFIFLNIPRKRLRSTKRNVESWFGT